MKKLVELFGIAPGLASQLEQAGVHSVENLAATNDLTRISEKSGVHVDLLKQWQERALLEMSRARLRRRRAAVLLIIVAGLFGGLTAWFYTHVLAMQFPPAATTFTWKASSSPNVIRYNVYRAQNSGGPYVMVAWSVGTSFTDSNVSSGRRYYYVVTAVDRSGAESAHSAEISLAVPGFGVTRAP